MTTAGVFQLVVDTTLMAGGTTPDIIELRVYGKPATGGTERLIDVHTLMGVQTAALWLSKPYGSPISIRFGITQPQGTARALPFSIWAY